MKRDILLKLEYAIKEALDLNLSINFTNDTLVINGTENVIDELKAYLFIHGYLYGINNKNFKLRIFKEA